MKIIMGIESFRSVSELSEGLEQSSLDTSRLSLDENKEVRLTSEELSDYKNELQDAETYEERINIIGYIIQEHKQAITREAREDTSSLRDDIENAPTLNEERLREILSEASSETPVSINILKIFLEELPNIEKSKKPFVISALLSIVNIYGVGIREIKNGQIKFNIPKNTSGIQVASREQTIAYQNIFNNYLRNGAFDTKDLQRALMYRSSSIDNFLNENKDLNGNIIEGSDISSEAYLHRLLAKHSIEINFKPDMHTAINEKSDEVYERFKNTIITNTTGNQADRAFIIGYFDDIRYNEGNGIDDDGVFNYNTVVDENYQRINEELTNLSPEQLHALGVRSGDELNDKKIRYTSDPIGTALDDLANGGASLGLIFGILGAIFLGKGKRLKGFLGGFGLGAVTNAIGYAGVKSLYEKSTENKNSGNESNETLRESPLFVKYKDLFAKLGRESNGVSKDQFEEFFLKLIDKPSFLSSLGSDLEVFRIGDENEINNFFNNLGVEINDEQREIYRLLFNGIFEKRESDGIGRPNDNESIREYLLRTSSLEKNEQTHGNEGGSNGSEGGTPEGQETETGTELPDLNIPSSTLETYEEMVNRGFELETPLEFIVIDGNKRFLGRDNEGNFVYSPVFNENNIDSDLLNLEILQNPSLNIRVEGLNNLLQELLLRNDTFEEANNIRNDLRERFITFSDIESAQNFINEKYIEIFNIFSENTRYTYNSGLESLTTYATNGPGLGDQINLRNLLNNEINDFSEIETTINRLKTLSRRSRQEYSSTNLNHLILSNGLDIGGENIDSELIMTLVEKIKSNDLDYIKETLGLSDDDIQKLREEINTIDANWINIRNEIRDEAREYFIQSGVPREEITNELINEYMNDAENSYKEQFYFSILSHIAIRKYISNNSSSGFFRGGNYNGENELVSIYGDIEGVGNFNLSNNQREIMGVVAKEVAILAITLPIGGMFMTGARLTVNGARAYRAGRSINTIQRADRLRKTSYLSRMGVGTAEVVAGGTGFYIAREAIDSIWENGNLEGFEYSLDENLKNITLFGTLKVMQSLRHMPTIRGRANPLHISTETTRLGAGVKISGGLLAEGVALAGLNSVMWEGDFTLEEVAMGIGFALLFRGISGRDRSDMMRVFRKPDGSIGVRAGNSPRANPSERPNPNPEAYFRHSNGNLYYRSNGNYYNINGRATPRLNTNNLSQINRTEYNRVLSEVRQTVSQRTREQMQTNRNPENLVSPSEKQAFIARHGQAGWERLKNSFNNELKSIRNAFPSRGISNNSNNPPDPRDPGVINGVKQLVIGDVQRGGVAGWGKAIAISGALEAVDYGSSFVIEGKEYDGLDSESLMNLLLFRYIGIGRAVLYKTGSEVLQATDIIEEPNIPIVDSVVNGAGNMAWDTVFGD